MCNIKAFPYPQSEEFYSLMGKFFADRGFIKELDNQLYNDENCTWFVYMENDVIKGFVSLQDKNKYSYIDNFYVLEPFRGSNIGNVLLDETTKKDGTLKAITRNEKALKMFAQRGFEIKSTRGRYYYLERCI